MRTFEISITPIRPDRAHAILALSRLVVAILVFILPGPDDAFVDPLFTGVFVLSYLLPAFMAWRRGGLPSRLSDLVAYLAATASADFEHVSQMASKVVEYFRTIYLHLLTLAVRELSILRYFISPGVCAKPDPRARGGPLFRSLLFTTRWIFAPVVELTDDEHFHWPRVHAWAATIGHWILLSQALTYITLYPMVATFFSMVTGLADWCLRAQAGIVAVVAVVFAVAAFRLDEDYSIR